MQLKEVEQVLERAPIFSGVEPQDVQRLLQGSQLTAYRLGETVLKAGDHPDCLFVIVSGRARSLALREGREVVVATLRPGGHFGESSVLGGAAELSVRAAEDLVTVRVPARLVSGLMGARPQVAAYFRSYLGETAIRSFLRLMNLLAPLSAADIQSLLGCLRQRSYQAGERVFGQGESGDRFYIVRSGSVEIVREDESGPRVPLRRLGPGQFFGELALLYETPRTASACCLEPTVLFELERRDFDPLVAREPGVKQRLVEAVSHYELEESLRRRWRLEDPLSNEPAPEPSRPPSVQWHGRFPFLGQTSSDESGATGLAMVLRFWGKTCSAAQLLRLAGGRSTRIPGPAELAAAAESVGFLARPLRPASLARVPLPILVRCQDGSYLVVYERRGSRFRLADPSAGMLWLGAEELAARWSGEAVEVNPAPPLALPDPDRQPSPSDQRRPSDPVRRARSERLPGRFLSLLTPLRGLLVQALGASLALELLGLASPVFTQILVDQALVHQNAGLLGVLVLGMLGVVLFETAFGALRQFLLLQTGTRLDLRMLVTCYRHLLRLPVGFFESRPTGEFTARFEEARKIRALVTGTAVQTVLDCLMVIVYLALMVYYSLTLTLALLAFVPLLGLFAWALSDTLRRVNREIFSRYAAAESLLIESINGIQTVKARAVETPLRWKWEALYVGFARTFFRGEAAVTWLDSLSQAALQLASLTLLYLGGLAAMGGRLTVGELMAFTILLNRVYAPVTRLVSMWGQVQEALVAVERLQDVLSAEPEQPSPQDAIRLPRLRGHLQLEDVSFRFPGSRRDVVAGIDLEVLPGQTLALVGRSGSGKSTLARLMAGIDPPTRGRIRVDGCDLSTAELTSYRRQLGVVLQDSFLFAGTIRQNIALADPAPDFERIVSAATLASAHEFICGLPLGYDTVVGERGMSLSGGQQQRIAIARALYPSPRILILDEATSNLDVESERAIQRNLKRLLADRTAIIIAHRLSTVQDADLIAVLDGGRIVETGTHADLMERKGLYYYLQSQQLQL